MQISSSDHKVYKEVLTRDCRKAAEGAPRRMDFFRKHKKKQAEDMKEQNTGTNDRKEESKLGDNVLNAAQHQLGDRKELEKKPEQPAPVLVVPPSLGIVLLLLCRLIS